MESGFQHSIRFDEEGLAPFNKGIYVYGAGLPE